MKLSDPDGNLWSLLDLVPGLNRFLLTFHWWWMDWLLLSSAVTHPQILCSSHHELISLGVSVSQFSKKCSPLQILSGKASCILQDYAEALEHWWRMLWWICWAYFYLLKFELYALTRCLWQWSETPSCKNCELLTASQLSTWLASLIGWWSTVDHISYPTNSHYLIPYLGC